jgi:hypothetical protein
VGVSNNPPPFSPHIHLTLLRYPLCGILEIKLPLINLSVTVKNQVVHTIELEIPQRYAQYNTEFQLSLYSTTADGNSDSNIATSNAPKVANAWPSSHSRNLVFEWTHHSDLKIGGITFNEMRFVFAVYNKFEKYLETAKALDVALSLNVPPSPLASNKFYVDIQFLPLKQIEYNTELIVTQKEGLGRWKVPVSLHAIAGEIDGTVTAACDHCLSLLQMLLLCAQRAQKQEE